MKQFTVEIQDSAEVPERLKEAKEYLRAHQASSAIVHIYAGLPGRGKLDRLITQVKNELPDVTIVGATAGGEIHDGLMTQQAMLVILTVFEKTEVVVHSYNVRPGEERSVGDEISLMINNAKDVKAAELLVDCFQISSKDFFSAVNRCAPKVKIFGMVPYAHDVTKPKFVFTGDLAESVTAIVITYAGKEFHVTTDYCIGWKPMGISMRVTKAEGVVLHEIDNKPALAVYNKYLQIPNDDRFFENAFEFPFLRYINDIYMMRMPYECLEDDSIRLIAPVNEGDVLYLSYGDVSTILAEVYEARGRMERFRPEYIKLYNCATRKTFWKRDINREIQPFERVADVSGCFTGGEIMRVNDELVHFNATLLIVGMREGLPNPQEQLRIHQLDRTDDIYGGQTSTVRRMANFINVAMQELLESNRQLQTLATTDGLTGMLNRREMSRIISERHDAGEKFSLVMADLDDFKNVNDTFGHDVGDVVLQEVSGLIRESVRGVADASIGRWGGEEFMVLLPGLDTPDAEKIAERLRKKMEKFNFEKIDHLTISLGVADSGAYADMKSIYHDVDRALYAAKSTGKNRVVVFKG